MINEKLKNILSKQFGIPLEKINDESHLVDDLGADSLDLLEIVLSQILFIPFGDYGDFSAVTTDPFGIPISPTFDALTDPPATVAINDLGTLS
jgi:hypothetical protein